jgi:hypothetical protein
MMVKNVKKYPGRGEKGNVLRIVVALGLRGLVGGKPLRALRAGGCTVEQHVSLLTFIFP